MEIAILRHGRPEAIEEKPITAREFRTWIKQYDASGLSHTSQPSESTLAHAKKCKIIICSTLPRSIDSAKAISFGNTVTKDKIFVEAGMPSSNWKGIKLKPKTWSVIFRLLWLAGYSNNSESKKDAKRRASQAADSLIKAAIKHEKIIYVGHGIFNRLLAKELIKRGWESSKTTGSKHWRLGVYANQT